MLSVFLTNKDVYLVPGEYTAGISEAVQKSGDENSVAVPVQIALYTMHKGLSTLATIVTDFGDYSRQCEQALRLPGPLAAFFLDLRIFFL